MGPTPWDPHVSETSRGPASAQSRKWKRIRKHTFPFLESVFSCLINQNALSLLESVFPLTSAQNTFSFSENVLSRRRFQFLPPGTCLLKFYSQIGPWCSTPHNSATVTSNEVNPKPTSSFHRARSDGTIFTMFQNSENDHFALSHNQPPPREYPFRRLFLRSFCTSSWSLLHPQASHNHHLHDSHAEALVSNLNL